MREKAKILNIALKNRVRAIEVNREFEGGICQLREEQLEAYAILYYLINNMDEENAVECSLEALADALMLEEETTRESLETLWVGHYISCFTEKEGFIYMVNKALARLRPS